MSFEKSRNILSNARIARGFYPVLVPASSDSGTFADVVRKASGHGRSASKGSSRGRLSRFFFSYLYFLLRTRLRVSSMMGCDKSELEPETND